MTKAERIFRAQLSDAIENVRSEAGRGDDFSRGMQSGASMVWVKLGEIQARDELHKEPTK